MKSNRFAGTVEVSDPVGTKGNFVAHVKQPGCVTLLQRGCYNHFTMVIRSTTADLVTWAIGKVCKPLGGTETGSSSIIHIATNFANGVNELGVSPLTVPQYP